MIHKSVPLTPDMVAWVVFILSFLGLIYTYGCYRNLRNRPQSKILSLSQGIVEVSGLTKFDTKGYLTSPYTKSKCCYYIATCRRRKDLIDLQEGIEPFILSEDGAECLIYPQKAIFVGAPFQINNFQEGDYFYTEQLILEGMRLFVDGFCATEEGFYENNDKLIIRAPNKKIDRVDFEFIISSFSKDYLIKKYFNWSMLFLSSTMGSVLILLCYYH
jgi:hypothetical protein